MRIATEKGYQEVRDNDYDDTKGSLFESHPYIHRYTISYYKMGGGYVTYSLFRLKREGCI